MRGQPADDKQRPSGDMIRKQFIVFPVVSPLSPDPLASAIGITVNGSGVKRLRGFIN